VPSAAQLLSHILYLQDILGYGHLIPIFWTLCYEFQFYLAFVGMLVLGHLLIQRLGRRAGTAVLRRFRGVVHSLRLRRTTAGLPACTAASRWIDGTNSLPAS
jgi:peptidoglycan/LPS O-acetylase OafA/YrhL